MTAASQLYKRASELFRQKEYGAALGAALEALASGDQDAHLIAGMLYEYGAPGVVQDPGAALMHYRFAYKQRHLVDAALGLARIRMEGPVVLRDHAEAFATYHEVVVKNGDPIALINLGRLLTQGWGCEPDFPRARALFERAIEAGYAFGHTYLALLEWKEKHYWQSIKQRYFAARQLTRLQKINPRDRRSRRI